jgi:hypothetical protein
VKADLIIQGQDLVRRDPHRRAIVVIEGVAIGNDRIEIIVAPGELEDYQDRVFTGIGHH